MKLLVLSVLLPTLLSELMKLVFHDLSLSRLLKMYLDDFVQSLIYIRMTKDNKGIQYCFSIISLKFLTWIDNWAIEQVWNMTKIFIFFKFMILYRSLGCNILIWFYEVDCDDRVADLVNRRELSTVLNIIWITAYSCK